MWPDFYADAHGIYVSMRLIARIFDFTASGVLLAFSFYLIPWRRRHG